MEDKLEAWEEFVELLDTALGALSPRGHDAEQAGHVLPCRGQGRQGLDVVGICHVEQRFVPGDHLDHPLR